MIQREESCNVKKFIRSLRQFQRENNSKPLGEREMFPITTDPYLFIGCIIDTLLGPDWYVVDPMNRDQVSTVALDKILYKYNKQYRNFCKKNRKE